MSSRRSSALALCLLLTLSTLLAHAQGAPGAPAGPAPSVLVLDAIPLLGGGAPGGERWMSVLIRVHNLGEQQIEGHLELESSLPYGGDDTRLVTRAPFGVAGKSRVTVQLPTHGYTSSPPQLKVRAFDTSGKQITANEMASPRPIEPLLLDFSVPSRLSPGLRGLRVAIQNRLPLRASYSYGAPSLSVVSPVINAATGDPALPDRAAGYAAVTAVVAQSDQVVGLVGPELDALVSWVIGGGALAIVISRPEDLRSPMLSALVGGSVRSAPPAAGLAKEAEFVVPTDTGGSYSYSPRNVIKRATPVADVAGKLAGYAGGNLHPSPWGASATYGLGEVHLLAFDPLRVPGASDEWCKLKMVDLVRHAWDRQASVSIPHAVMPLDHGGLDGIRKQLDPNEGARWAVVVALILLIVYSVLAGPLNFYLATKKGRPLRALWHLPIWAGGAMLAIVILGAFAKGVSGRARHLSVIEIGAGMSRGAITRFRGFYSPAAEQLMVRAFDRGNVLDVAGDSSETARELVVDRDGARLEKFQAKPWQTVIVREDGFTSLGGGISIVQQGDDVAVKNRSARDLVGVILWRPKAAAVYFPRIKDGETVLASAGRALPKTIGRMRHYGTLGVRQLDAAEFAATLDADVKGAGDAWKSLEALVQNGVGWWPDDVPALIGQLEGGEGRSNDSGLRLDSDRLLVRVLGWGGVP